MRLWSRWRRIAKYESTYPILVRRLAGKIYRQVRKWQIHVFFSQWFIQKKVDFGVGSYEVQKGFSNVRKFSILHISYIRESCQNPFLNTHDDNANVELFVYLSPPAFLMRGRSKKGRKKGMIEKGKKDHLPFALFLFILMYW